MNIKLVFRDSNFKLDIMEDTPCQYLYSVAQKVFRKKSTDIILFYGKIEIENDSRLLFDVMEKDYVSPNYDLKTYDNTSKNKNTDNNEKMRKSSNIVLFFNPTKKLTNNKRNKNDNRYQNNYKYGLDSGNYINNEYGDNYINDNNIELNEIHNQPIYVDEGINVNLDIY